MVPVTAREQYNVSIAEDAAIIPVRCTGTALVVVRWAKYLARVAEDRARLSMYQDMDIRFEVIREDYLPEDLLPIHPIHWNEPEFMDCPSNPNKVWVLSSGGYILFDRKKDMITSAQTRLFLGDELLPLVAVDIVDWADKGLAYVCVHGPLEAMGDLDKIVAGVDLDVIAFPNNARLVKGCRQFGRVILSFKQLQLGTVCRWIDNLIVNHPSGEVELTMNVSFMCALEFGGG